MNPDTLKIKEFVESLLRDLSIFKERFQLKCWPSLGSYSYHFVDFLLTDLQVCPFSKLDSFSNNQNDVEFFLPDIFPLLQFWRSSEMLQNVSEEERNDSISKRQIIFWTTKVLGKKVRFSFLSSFFAKEGGHSDRSKSDQRLWTIFFCGQKMVASMLKQLRYKLI